VQVGRLSKILYHL